MAARGSHRLLQGTSSSGLRDDDIGAFLGEEFAIILMGFHGI